MVFKNETCAHSPLQVLPSMGTFVFIDGLPPLFLSTVFSGKAGGRSDHKRRIGISQHQSNRLPHEK